MFDLSRAVNIIEVIPALEAAERLIKVVILRSVATKNLSFFGP